MLEENSRLVLSSLDDDNSEESTFFVRVLLS